MAYNGVALAIGAAGAGRHQWDVSVTSIIHIGWVSGFPSASLTELTQCSSETSLKSYMHPHIG